MNEFHDLARSYASAIRIGALVVLIALPYAVASTGGSYLLAGAGAVLTVAGAVWLARLVGRLADRIGPGLALARVRSMAAAGDARAVDLMVAEILHELNRQVEAQIQTVERNRRQGLSAQKRDAINVTVTRRVPDSAYRDAVVEALHRGTFPYETIVVGAVGESVKVAVQVVA